MRLPPAPLRFVMLVAGGWIGFRTIALIPAAEAGPEPALPAAEAGRPRVATPLPPRAGNAPVTIAAAGFGTAALPFAPASVHRFALAATPGLQGIAPAAAPLLPATSRVTPVAPAADPPSPFLPIANARPITPSPRRLTGSAWLFLRDGGGAIAPGVASLGGSQAGMRLTYRVVGERAPLALSLRITAAIDRPRQSEAAVGIDWRPVPALPIHILAERREAIGREGRSDFALLAYGGGERRFGRVRVDGYAQAGIVGRDGFADGALRVTRTVGPIDVGGGAWGGAQPGAARVDVGPHFSTRLPVPGLNVRASAEWRFRIAGDAAPDSGPALTIAADF